jgi:hypothetical protein
MMMILYSAQWLEAVGASDMTPDLLPLKVGLVAIMML